jgi:hypothetical protein
VFPQDEKEAAVLLMALSYGMVHGWSDHHNILITKRFILIVIYRL